jgi:DNA-directed RNA polymerase sigma subunit (sigma70/sigma32)
MRVIPRVAGTDRKRDFEMRLQPAAPIRTLEECACEMSVTVEQAKYLHEQALQKLRAALSAWGYHKGDR